MGCWVPWVLRVRLALLVLREKSVRWARRVRLDQLGRPVPRVTLGQWVLRVRLVRLV